MRLSNLDYFNQESKRLIFRRLTIDDVESWKEFFENNDSLHFLAIDPSITIDEHAETWVRKQLERNETQGLGHLAVIEKENNVFIGMGGILPREIDGNKVFEISYSLKPNYWNKGYGTEIAKQMKLYGIENKISNQFISIIHKENTASMNVAKKNGMQSLYESTFMGMNVYVFGTENG